MRDREIDDILKAAAQARPDPDAALVDRIAKTIGDSAVPVRRLPPGWVLAGGLVLISGALAAGGAAVLGIYGLPKLGGAEIAAIFPALALLTWFAATLCVEQMTPGSRRRAAPGWIVVAGSVALTALFAALFHDYRTVRFVPAGLVCLTAGLLQAIPAGLAGWLMLRRGFFVNPVSAGLTIGALAGLVGVTMLELHCANFEALHVMVWHTAVLPVSSAAGAMVGWAAHSLSRGRRSTGGSTR
jgi:hypothetical protein